jgi:hypothetical protein
VKRLTPRGQPQQKAVVGVAFLFEPSIDIETYDRHAEKLREELTPARIDCHSGQLDELDVEGILAFAERVLPGAADPWVQASLEQRQRLQQLFFPDGIAFDGKCFIGTRVTAPAFSYLRTIEDGNERMWPRFSPVGTTYASGTAATCCVARCYTPRPTNAGRRSPPLIARRSAARAAGRLPRS